MVREDLKYNNRLTIDDVGSVPNNDFETIKKLAKRKKTQRICLEGEEDMITEFKVWCLLRKKNLGEGLRIMFEFYKKNFKE